MSQNKKRSSTGHVLLPASSDPGPDAAKPLLLHRDVGSWTFGRGTVVWTIWPAVLLHTVFAAAVTTISLRTQVYLAVPPVLITVLGVVIGFVISYRAMSGYDRYWTGRTSWGDIIKTSRTMSRLIWIHVPLKVEKQSSSMDRIHAENCKHEKRQALDLIEGFAVAVKHHLRGEAGIYYEDLYHLVKPLHKHSRVSHAPKSGFSHLHSHVPQAKSSALDNASPSLPSHRIPTLPPDPIIPAINEYGALRSDSCSSADESERPFLFPSSPPRVSRPRILTELVPFSSFFSSVSSFFTRRKKYPTDLLADNDEEDVNDGELSRRCAASRGRKFRPVLPGGGKNIPLDILRNLSEWIAVLDERGTVSGNPLGGMYSCIASFEDSLSTLERILTTPLPLCVWLYLFLLPFQLIDQFGWYTIPGVCIAAFFYIGFLAAGEEIEQPFGYDENDLDLDLFCHHIIHAEIESLKRRDCANNYLPEVTVNPDRTTVNSPMQNGTESLANGSGNDEHVSLISV
ncbi:uncharacterized protein FOMMEDRAFT_92818 [Fomitiporia mediterranea MF3/22]|uniref:uncharacterized protein n=1 Tax=Fomitiporia mediterranea (strain MF3/22) TaxID=694068 RepID=UPI0004407627|nr:uncharacterized protein FOMMEDRAFT_92818 [Fomitiporia mediterranea MF3/22]EJC99916.1 hypothetical protein FOMMEDRAFT_92818 [Fomitiporia mediterranea MF3/22]